MKIGNVEVYGIIYKITNKVNGKVYIGQTVNGFNFRYNRLGTGVERVYNYYKSRKRRGKNFNNHLLNSIEKYGIEFFEVKEIFDIAFSKDELDIKEKTWIIFYKSNDENYGYNKTDGGGNGKHNQEYNEKVSKSLKETTKNKGENHWHYGKENSKETRMKISEANKGVPKSEEHKKKLSESRKIFCSKEENIVSKKSVVCLTTKEIFSSIRKAMEKYNITGSNDIIKSINSKGTCGRLQDGTPLVWMLLEDYNNASEEEIQQILEISLSKIKCRSMKNTICITTKEIFSSAKEGAKKYNIFASSISQCCNGKIKSAGKHNGKKLVWKYLMIIEL